MGKKIILRRAQELPSTQLTARQFRCKIQDLLAANEAYFQACLAELPPDKFVEVYIKLLPYGISKAPEEKVISPEQMAIIDANERNRIIDLISSEEIIEDIDPEE